MNTKQGQRVALVTGANRGLGLETCRQLARQGFRVLLSSRDSASGQARAEALAKQGLAVSHLTLDIASQESCERAARIVRDEVGRLDVLVNNAGVLLDSKRGEWELTESSAFRVRPEIVRQTFDVNTLGAYRMCQLFLPIMQKSGHGRVVNVSSGMGQLEDMGRGWPAYRISKAALNAVTAIFAAETRGTDILINSACPGWVRTDMGGAQAELTVEEGVDTIVWLATLPPGGPTGGFYQNRERIPW